MQPTTSKSTRCQIEKYREYEIHTKSQRSDSLIECMTDYEISEIKEIISANQYSFGKYTCNRNILKILQQVYEELVKKLKVVIVTHEKKPIKYFDDTFIHHVFILADTKNGLIIFDPQLEGDNFINSNKWMRSVYDEFCINSTLDINENCYNSPQFRFLNASVYMENFEDSLEFITLSPESRPLGINSGMSKSKLWENSFRANFYEVLKLFTEDISYKNTMNKTDGYQSPMPRLQAQEVEYISQFYRST